jgi:hypothetical protein
MATSYSYVVFVHIVTVCAVQSSSTANLSRVQRPMAVLVSSHPSGSPVRIVRLSMYAHRNSRTAERIFMRCDMGELYEHFLRRLNFGLGVTVVPTSVHDWGAEYLPEKETFRTDVVRTNRTFCVLYTFHMPPV